MCIVRYLETSKYCPICDVQVHKTKPLLNIRWEPMWILNLLLGQNSWCFPSTCSSDMIHLSSLEYNWGMLQCRHFHFPEICTPIMHVWNTAKDSLSCETIQVLLSVSTLFACSLNINVDGAGVIFQPPSRSDKTLQDIVYKLVPGLFKSKSMATNLFVNSCFSAQLKKRAAPLFSTVK